MSRIFISYKRVDKEKVFWIKDQIESALGEKCWIDLDGIESDAQFVNVIMNAIDDCEVFLFMYTRAHSIIIDFKKDWTVRELNYAQEEKKRIVFVNLDSVPLTKWFRFMFPQKQQVDATNNEDVKHLISDLRSWLANERKGRIEPVRSELDFADLGLSVLWATMNLDFPNLDSYDDTANKIEQIGGNMRMPTIGEYQELWDNCKHEWILQDNLRGIRFTALNGRSIFIPTTGYQGKALLEKSSGCYWVHNTNQNDDDNRWCCKFTEKTFDPQYDIKGKYGLACRLVKVESRSTGSNLLCQIQQTGKISINVSSEQSSEYDLSALLLNGNGLIEDDSNFVFYNSDCRTEPFSLDKFKNRRFWRSQTMPKSKCGSVIAKTCDCCSLDEDCCEMLVDCSRIPEQIEEIVFCVSSYQSFDKGQQFTVKVNDNMTSRTVFQYNITIEDSDVSAILIGMISKWQFQVMNDIFRNGLQGVLDRYYI